MENEMQPIVAPPIPSRSQSRDLEQGRDRIRPEFYSSPQLSPSPLSPEQTSSSISENFSLHPATSTTSSRSRTPTSRSTSPYPSSFISQEPTDSLLPPGQEEGELQRRLSTRLGTATAVRQPSFPQFRNSIITKHSMSLITRPGIVHVRPGQALARNSPTMTSSPLNESITGSPESISIGSMREAQVSLINVSGSPKAGTRTTARASLLAGPGPAIRPSGPMTCIPDNSPTTLSFPSLHSSSDITEEKNRFMDMKIQKILGPRDSAWSQCQAPYSAKKSTISTPGIQEVKKMIGDMKDSGDRYGSKGTIRLMKEKMGRGNGNGLGEKDLWQSMYSMSGETLGESRRMEGTMTPDQLVIDDEYGSGRLGVDRMGGRRRGGGVWGGGVGVDVLEGDRRTIESWRRIELEEQECGERKRTQNAEMYNEHELVEERACGQP